MSFDTVEAIRQAEAEAERAVQMAEAEAQSLLQEASAQAYKLLARRDEVGRAHLKQAVRQAEREAEAACELTEHETERQVALLRRCAEHNMEEAVQYILTSLRG